MERDEIISMARDAGISSVWAEASTRQLERFAAIVAAHEREKAKVVFEELEREVKTELINAINGAVELEREACAKVCEGYHAIYRYEKRMIDELAAAIRARGEE